MTFAWVVACSLVSIAPLGWRTLASWFHPRCSEGGATKKGKSISKREQLLTVVHLLGVEFVNFIHGKGLQPSEMGQAKRPAN